MSRTSLLFAAALCACATAGQDPEARYPNARDPLCSYIALESDETPAHDNVDSVMLVAVYRLREPGLPPPKEPIELKFQVQRSRIDDLRGRLEAHPEVICRPDRDARYQVEAKAFEDFSPVQP